MLRTLVALLCMGFAVPASARLGENVPQLVKRFGKSYAVEPVQIGRKYKFRSANVSVDVVVANGAIARRRTTVSISMPSQAL